MGISDRDVAVCLASSVLELILFPTEACNFRCTYCYEDFRHGRMEPRVVRGVKNLLTLRAPELVALNVSWFGGEPLLALDIVEDVLQHTRLLASEHPRLCFSSDITTNAYLLSGSVFERLLDRGVNRYQISFDGPRQWHDKKRILANGRATFDRVWGNLVAMRDVSREFAVIVRLHVDRENYRAIPQFLETYHQAFGSDHRFRLFMRALSRLGGPNDATLPVFEEEEAKGALRALSQCARERHIERLPMEAEVPLICYAARANSFVVRADGRINKCTVALENPMNQVGCIHEDGHVELDAQKMRGWMRGLWSEDPRELECPMQGYADPVSPPVAGPGSRPVNAMVAGAGG